MKRVIAIISALAVFFTLIMPLTAFADEPYEMENPFYSGSRQSMGRFSFIEESVQKTYKGQKYFTRGTQMYKYVKDKLDNRKRAFNIYCLSKYEITSTYAATTSIVQQAFYGSTEDELSKTSTDGDYVRWAVSSFGTKTVDYVTKKDGYYFYKIRATFLYYDTAAEEKQVDSAVNSFLNSFKTSGKSDAEIIKGVHDYICKKTTYAYEAADDPYNNKYAFSPYGALIKGKCVCQGYAAAFYRICKELGYGVRFVSSDSNWGCHAWNIIQLDGKYYIIDLTWDDEAMDSGDETDITPYYYFLVDYETSKSKDSFFNEHSLESSFYNTDYFNEKYKSKFSDKCYYPDTEKRLSDCSVTLSSTSYVYSGKANTPKITVKDGGVLLKEGSDYSLSYSSNTDTGLGKVKINGIGDYSGTYSVRNFLIAPKKTESLSVTKVTDGTLELKWSYSGGNVSGWAVQKHENGAWKNIAVSKECACTVSGLNPAEKQKLRVRAYKKVFKRNIYGNESNTVICCTKPEKVRVKPLKLTGRKIETNWKKVKCTGYEIQYSTDKNMKNARKKRVTGASNLTKTVKALKKGKKHYVRVRAFKKYKVNGKTKTVYGKWSLKKSVKVK